MQFLSAKTKSLVLIFLPWPPEMSLFWFVHDHINFCCLLLLYQLRVGFDGSVDVNDN